MAKKFVYHFPLRMYVKQKKEIIFIKLADEVILFISGHVHFVIVKGFGNGSIQIEKLYIIHAVSAARLNEN